jgi:PAS domain S-box-containing protein
MNLGSDESRYRLLVEGITDYAIYLLDPGGQISSWNPGAARFKGYAAEEVLGRHFSQFYTPEDRARRLPDAALKTAADTGRFEAEGWRVRKDGTRFWAHVVIDPIRNDAGDLIGFAKITRDLTERKEAAEALRRTEEQFRLLVQGVSDYAIYMLDRRGNVVSWNSGAQRIKGYEAEEVVGEHFSRFYTLEDLSARLPERALNTAEREGRFENEGWRVRKDGTRFWAHVVIDAIRSDGGDVIGFAKITRDITERMEAQRALEEAREALFQAQKLEAIGQLTGGVAHDFNNLLMAVLGSLELVQKRLPYDPKVTPLIENAISGAQRGTLLTQRMLAFARKQDLRLQPVDAATLAKGMLDFIRRSLGPQIDVRLAFPRALPRVRTDPIQLETALLNLVLNARDAMPRGGLITLSGETRRLEKPERGLLAGEFLRLSVQDTGEGMDPETLARATEPFFTTKGVGKGTGLGLSMVHGLAAQSGGALHIESAPGAGTRIDVWLPVATEGVIEGLSDQTSCPGSSPQRNLLILAVDDDALVLTNTVAMIEDLGHQALSASSGDEALAVLSQRSDVDLLIVDEMMPGMRGSELARRVLSSRPGLPIIIASGYADLERGPGQLALGLPRLSKPFTQAQLSEMLAAEELAAISG